MVAPVKIDAPLAAPAPLTVIARLPVVVSGRRIVEAAPLRPGDGSAKLV